MTTLNQQSPQSFGTTIVSGDDTSPSHPPLLAVGPLAWLKKNLFNTVGDSILTFIVLFVIGAAGVSFVTWTVGQANWYAINFNLRLLMLGQYDPTAEWRVTIVVVLFAFTIGAALATWTRMRLAHAIILAVIVALTFIVPVVVNATIPLPPFYASVGAVKIGGEGGQAPQAQVAFLGRANETVSVRLATQFDSDESLSDLHSFADPAANAALNAAGTRLTTEARIAELNRLLAADSLTPNQRTRAEGELKRLKVSDPVVDTLKLNQQPVHVTILDSNLQPLPNSDVILDSGETGLSVTLPADGWYVLQKTMDDTASISLLETKGIYPVLLRNTTRGADENGATVGNVAQYIRMTDSYITEVGVPADKDGKALPFVVVTNNGYRNTASLGDYLRLYVSPFLNQINDFLLVVFVAGLLGHVVAQVLDQTFSPPNRRRATSTRLVMWLLVAVPILSFIAIWGFSSDTVHQILELLFTLAGLFGVYLAGTQILRSRLMSLGVLIVIAVIGIIFRSQNIDFGLLSDPISRLPVSANLTLVITAAVTILISLIIAFMGYFWGKGTSSRTAVIGLVICAVIIVICIVGEQGLPPLLADKLPLTDTRKWGGVLLTMMLTIVGIIGSLPLGILLALGRRSKMPVVSIVSTLYIEVLRGIPFITVLFMAQLLIPLINPSLASFPGAFRAMIATVLFSAAYNAEVVRGGLQAIPPGQDEAAKALGLNGLQVTFFITLPQALRLVIPPMMGNFVGMFKDTSLVAIVGLLDLTGMAQNIVNQTEFLGLRRETFMFIAIFYFIFSYVIAAISRRIEATGAGQAIKMQI